MDEAHRILDEYDVPNGPIYSVEDMMDDPHYAARKMIESVDVAGLGALKMPGIMPKFSETPGSIKWPGPELGAHNEEIYIGLLGMSEGKLQQLKKEDII